MNLLPAFAGTPALDSVYHVTAECLLAALPNDYVDLVVTSPPYDNLRKYNGFTWDFERIARETYRVLKPGGVLVWVVGDATIDGSETLTSFRQALYFKDVAGFRMHDTMIYQKDSYPFPDTSRYYQQFEYMFVLSKGAPKSANLLTQKSRYAGVNKTATQRNADGTTSRLKYETGKAERVLDNVWPLTTGYMRTTPDVDAYAHPAMFPEKLAERHILTWSNPGDLVVDFFGGSGTTAKMARAYNRRYLTNDVSLEYVDLMRKRLAKPHMVDMFAQAAS